MQEWTIHGEGKILAKTLKDKNSFLWKFSKCLGLWEILVLKIIVQLLIWPSGYLHVVDIGRVESECLKSPRQPWTPLKARVVLCGLQAAKTETYSAPLQRHVLKVLHRTLLFPCLKGGLSWCTAGCHIRDILAVLFPNCSRAQSYTVHVGTHRVPEEASPHLWRAVTAG